MIVISDNSSKRFIVIEPGNEHRTAEYVALQMPVVIDDKEYDSVEMKTGRLVSVRLHFPTNTIFRGI